MEIQFIGATETVTGSKYLISSGPMRVLIDCGLFQGLKNLRLRNWRELPFQASQIDSLILTHAHIDHSGYIPVLIKQGFRGKIYCSHGTKELCKILLPDSGYLQEEEAFFANKYKLTNHEPALPLYTRKEAEDSIQYFHPVDFDQEIDLGGGLKFSLLHAGHILGASMIRLSNGKKTVLFSGDLGRPHDVMMNPPAIVDETDYLVLESTYGNRLHESIDPKIELAEVITRTSKRGGTTIIPAFAVGRAQAVLFLIQQLNNEKKIPNIPIYLDSPMATDVTDLYCHFSAEHRLTNAECAAMSKVAKIINTVNDSKALDVDNFPKIIISASGMATGGRVVHHLKTFITNPKNTILFTGYQAAGTRGQTITNGAKEVKIHGQYFPIRAEVVVQDALSAHSDYQETLDWLRNFKRPIKEVFLTHGEPIAADVLRRKIKENFGWNCRVPEYLEKVNLD
jgi:metallo-beta-lactamase family protein